MLMRSVLVAFVITLFLSGRAAATDFDGNFGDDGGCPEWSDPNDIEYNAGDRLVGTNNTTYTVHISFTDANGNVLLEIDLFSGDDFRFRIPPGSTTVCISRVGQARGQCTGGCRTGKELKEVPTVSEWGLLVLTLLGLICGTIMFVRRRTD